MIRGWLESPLRALIRTDALENPPRLMQGIGYREHVFDLISAGKRPTVEKDYPRAILRQKISGTLEHEFLTEIILPG